MALLTEHDIETRLTALPGWTSGQGSIAKQFTLPTFHRAIAFVVQIGMLSDVADHHPDIDIRYNVVKVMLSTHSAGGVTEKDIALATQIETAGAGVP